MKIPHSEPCSFCPSAHYPLDPEVIDFLSWPVKEMGKMKFKCAWRPDKFCRGNWDLIENEKKRRSEA